MMGSAKTGLISWASRSSIGRWIIPGFLMPGGRGGLEPMEAHVTISQACMMLAVAAAAASWWWSLAYEGRAILMSGGAAV